nr:MAG TPA: hypothetical protein [Caudoviricetes sp.]
MPYSLITSLILSCSIIISKFCFCKDTLIKQTWYHHTTN